MQRLCVGTPLDVNPGAPYPAGNIFRSDGQRAIKSRGHLFIAAQSFVSKRDLLKYGKIAWVQLQSLFHFLEGFLPAPLTAVDVARHQGNSRFVWKRPPGNSQLLPGSIVIPIRPVKMLRESQMRLSRFRAQAANGLDRCLGQLKTRVGMIEAEEVNPIMRSSQQIIGNHERWVARHGLTKQLHGLE